MTETIAAIIGGAIGSGTTGIFAVVAIQLQRRAEERRQIRELAVQVALENWKDAKEMGQREHAKGKNVVLYPLDTYLIHAMSLVRALDGTAKTEIEVRAMLRESFSLGKVAAIEAKVQTDQNRQ